MSSGYLGSMIGDHGQMLIAFVEVLLGHRVMGGLHDMVAGQSMQVGGNLMADGRGTVELRCQPGLLRTDVLADGLRLVADGLLRFRELLTRILGSRLGDLLSTLHALIDDILGLGQLLAGVVLHLIGHVLNVLHARRDLLVGLIHLLLDAALQGIIRGSRILMGDNGSMIFQGTSLLGLISMGRCGVGMIFGLARTTGPLREEVSDLLLLGSAAIFDEDMGTTHGDPAATALIIG